MKLQKKLFAKEYVRERGEALFHIDCLEMYTTSGTQGAFDLFHSKLMELHNNHFPKVR